MGEIVSDALSSDKNGKTARARYKPVWAFYALLVLFLVVVLAFVILHDHPQAEKMNLRPCGRFIFSA